MSAHNARRDEMMQYVMGFCLVHDGSHVVLVKKEATDPSGAGWNGVGGIAEEAETPAMAMAREWREETGLEPVEWQDVGLCTGKDHSWAIHVFVARPGREVSTVGPCDMAWDTWSLREDWRAIEFCPWARTMLSMALEAEEASDIVKSNCPHLSVPA